MKASNKVILFLVLIVAALLGLYQYKKYRIPPTIDQFKQEVLDENDQKRSLEQFKGKKLIITYYASWCGDCLKEMKSLNEVKASQFNDVEVLAITDENREKMLNFKTKKNYPFTFFRLPFTFDKLNIYTLPVTYIINSDGKLVYEQTGAIDWKDASFLAHIKTLM